MRIAFDEQIFLLQRHGGVSKYFVELIRAIEDLDQGVSVDLPYATVCNEHALQAWPGRFKPAKGPLQPYPQLAVSATRPRRAGEGVDIVHHTFYNSRFLRDYPGVPKVVTIYDMIPELLGERGRFGNPHMAKREYVRRASAIICISESARDDMLAVYGIPDCPVSVVHLGVDPSFAAGGPRPPGFPERYVLFVGRRGGYKDFATVAHAFEAIADGDPDLSLVCVGGGATGTGGDRDARVRGRSCEPALPFPTRRCRAPTQTRRASSSRRATRDSGFPQSRRWPRAPRRSWPGHHPCQRWAAGLRPTSNRETPMTSHRS